MGVGLQAWVIEHSRMNDFLITSLTFVIVVILHCTVFFYLSWFYLFDFLR